MVTGGAGGRRPQGGSDQLAYYRYLVPVISRGAERKKISLAGGALSLCLREVAAASALALASVGRPLHSPLSSHVAAIAHAAFAEDGGGAERFTSEADSDIGGSARPDE